VQQSNDHPSAYILSWGLPRPGCEQAALELMGRVLDHLEALEQAGEITGHQIYVLTTGSYSHQNGLLVLQGGFDAVHAVARSKELKTLLAQSGALLQDVTRNFAVGGPREALAGPTGVYGAAVSALR
jgi:hypothetical protein